MQTLVDEIPAVRAMKGCLAFVPFADATDPQALGVLQEWETQEDFAAFLASPHFATVGKTLRPLMTGAPASRRFDAKLVESPN